MLLDKLEQNIYNSFPELLNEGIGCIIKTQTGQILKIYSEDERYYNCYNEEVCSTSISKPLNKGSYEIIGKPITLCDILKWLYSLNILYTKYDDILWNLFVMQLWDLSSVFYKDQPQPLKDLLINLINDCENKINNHETEHKSR